MDIQSQTLIDLFFIVSSNDQSHCLLNSMKSNIYYMRLE